MEFTLPPEADDLRLRIRSFVDENVIPLEADPANRDAHEMIREEILTGLREKAKASGLWALRMPKARGGGGIDTVTAAACYEEMGRSPFGAVVFNFECYSVRFF